MQKTIIAIIPARGGSKRLPRKNLRMLNGISLVALAIMQALGSQLIQRVFVSTEDDEIERVAREYGAEIIKRPMVLAQGESGSVLRVIQHALAYLEKYEAFKPLIVALIQPTSPLRTAEDIDNTIQLMLDTGCDSVVSKCGDRENGAVYVSRRYVFIEQNRILGSSCGVYQMPEERSVDIDTEEDLARAEVILKGGQDDRSRVLSELQGPDGGEGDDKGGKRGRGRPRKVPAFRRRG